MSKIPSLPASKLYLVLDLFALCLILVTVGLSLNAVIRARTVTPPKVEAENPQQQVIDQALEKLSTQVID